MEPGKEDNSKEERQSAEIVTKQVCQMAYYKLFYTRLSFRSVFFENLLIFSRKLPGFTNL